MDYEAIAQVAVDKWHANQDPIELERLLYLVKPGGVVVEIGCDRGGMLWAFKEVGAHRVIGIDLPAAGFDSGFSVDSHNTELIVGNSQTPQTRDHLTAMLDGEMVDLLFVDADHTESGVRRDFLQYRSLVRPGGFIAFHDIYGHFLFPKIQVDRFWWWLQGEYPDMTWEIVNHKRPWGHGMGIGVMQCV